MNENRLFSTEEVALNKDLSHYYLLFCAINSQLKRNDAALIAATKGNSIIKNSSILLYQMAIKSRINA